MFWRTKKDYPQTQTIAAEVAGEAEGLYRSGKYHCAEAVVLALKNRFRPELPDSVVQMAAGFGGGSGTGCICGAVSGATMALGIILPEDKGRVKKLTKELHTWFKSEYSATCCKIILERHKKICPELTGKVAGKVAEMLS